MSTLKRTFIIIIILVVLSVLLFLLFGKSVSGMVLSANGDEPIPFASVTINGVTTLCDENGQFERWLPPLTQKLIIVNHPCFDRFTKYLDGFDLNKDIEVRLNNSTFESMLTLCQEQLHLKTHFITKASSITYSHPESDAPVAHKLETLFIITPEAQLFCQDASNTKDGDLDVGHRTIVVGSDPGNLGKISYESGIPQIYYRHDSNDWITFSSSEDLDFEVVMLGSKNPKNILEPLYSYGNTTTFELLKPLVSTNGNGKILGCRTSWDPKGPLMGKSISFYFLQTGEWYDIVFEDTGENPISKQGKYHFSCLETGSHINIAIPENAENTTLKELNEDSDQEG